MRAAPIKTEEPSLRWSERVGRQLRSPEGTAGRLAGWLMSHVNAQPYDLAIRALDLRPSDSVLELGFGPGAGLRRLSKALPNGRICGLDHSATMVDAATRRNRRAIAEGRIELRRAGFSSLPWGDETFDKALLVNVVYFFDRSGDEAREIYRTLKPGGLVVVYATDADTMSKWPFAGSDTHRKFVRADLHELLVGAGFRPKDVRVQAVTLSLGVGGLVAVARKRLLANFGSA
jgi:SAM-dependent methyltransferase